MREVIGYWYFWKNGVYRVVVEDGLLQIEYVPGGVFGYKEDVRFKKRFGERFFDDESFLIGCNDSYVDEVVYACVRKSEESGKKICEGYRAKREARKEKEAKKLAEWNRLREKFDGVVIGLDSKIDVYESGFSVRVLFGSDVSFNGKKQFLAKNKIKFVAWVMHELSQSKNAMRKIGDIKFYRPVEIINLRAREVEVKFEVKEVA